jgi:uncharacterized protein
MLTPYAMMKQLVTAFILICFVALSINSVGQTIKYNPKLYLQSLDSFQKKYIEEHEVVKGADKAHFAFYPIKQQFALQAKFERIIDTVGFTMKTVNNGSQKYFVYGKVYFTINALKQELFVYQSKMTMQMPKYKNHLFVPFLDATSGDESYGGGRYIDLLTTDISNDTVLLDFNKCYNPYCAYAAGYKCPIPPKENILSIAITAGEKNFIKNMH